MPKTKKPYLMKSANIFDRATKEAVVEFTFATIGGGHGTTVLKPSELLDGDRVVKHLLDRNAVLPANEIKRAEMVQKAVAMDPKVLMVLPQSMGWQNKRRGFLAATGAVGRCSAREVALPAWVTAKQTIIQSKKGTLEGWIMEVAKRSCNSSAAITTTCAAYAAPLLVSAKMASFGINIYGISKAGKTSALLAAASIGGIGVENRMPNFRSTTAARGELSCAFNDQLLPLNEVGLLAGKRMAYEPIRELIYQVSEGRDTIRHSESKYARAARASEFRTIFVSTAEHSFDRYAKLANQRRDEGEYARCLDIAACAEGGHTIMDRVPKNVRKSDRKAWRRQEVIQLRAACAAHHGHALPAYINHLIGLGKRLKKEVRLGQKAFLEQVDMASLEGALQHAARNFSLLASGGRLAIQAGLLPIAEKKLMRILAAVFHRAVAEIAIFQTPEKAVRAVLAKKLNAIQTSVTAANWNGKTMKKGYAAERDGSRWYTIKSTEFRDWFGGNKDQIEAALDFLARKGCLLKASRRGTDVRSRESVFGDAVSHVTWPNGKPTRSVVFRDPFRAVRKAA
jgi:putative DNA primase/helicase